VIAVALAVVLLLVAGDPGLAQLVDPEKGTRDGSPLDDLPPRITLVADFGVRPDWSPDGTTLLYLRSGRRFAFQFSIDGPTEGEGDGLLIFDLDRFESAATERRS
jgi:hypothetical protein